MSFFKSKVFIVGFLLVAIGVGFLMAENTFYQTINSDGVLQESLFMPLGFLSILIGGLLFSYLIIKKSWNLIKPRLFS